MDTNKLRRKPFQRIAIVLACIMVFCVFAPVTAGAQEGGLSTAKAAIATDDNTIGAASYTYAVGVKDTFYYTRNGVRTSGATFKSGNTKIFSITKAGKFTAKKTGTAKLYVYYGGAKVVTKTIKVVRNRINFNLSSGGRNTGYTSYDQAGNPTNPTVTVKPVYMEYTARKTFKVQYQIYNWSTFNWRRVRSLRNVRVSTPKGTPIINFSTFTLNNGFALPAGKTLNFTITYSGDQVKKFVDLTKQSSMSWALDWTIG